MASTLYSKVEGDSSHLGLYPIEQKARYFSKPKIFLGQKRPSFHLQERFGTGADLLRNVDQQFPDSVDQIFRRNFLQPFVRQVEDELGHVTHVIRRPLVERSANDKASYKPSSH